VIGERSTPELEALTRLFYPELELLGDFTEVAAEEMPEAARQLLAHDNHMTVTIESFHGCAVDVEVLQTHVTPTHYARKILLKRQSDGRVVQFGIVRLTLYFLAPQVRQEIEDARVPLGRILIENSVLRNVRLLSLWRLVPGPDLCRLFGMNAPQICYGRTALIYCDNVPAVELLEIVIPE
jgi:chorismate-pyruvate lyase